jgi:hypothetical protein
LLHAAKHLLKTTALLIGLAVFEFPFCASAQIELTSSIDCGFPLLTNANNSNLFYNQFTAGLGFGVSYKPDNTQFFPTLKVYAGRTRLPLTEFDDGKIADVNYNYFNTILYGNMVFHIGEKFNTLYLLLGIGFTKLKQKGLYLTQNNTDQMRGHIDSVSNLDSYLPIIAGGVEYVWGQTDSRPAYICFGFNLQYLDLIEGRNFYAIDVQEPNYVDIKKSAFLSGQAFFPNFYVSLHYLFKKDPYTQKYSFFKKD